MPGDTVAGPEVRAACRSLRELTVLGKEIRMRASAALRSTPEGPGSVSGAPNLPAGFTDTFTSRSINTGALRQHAVIGGGGPPLLLVHGGPATWYAWRLLMPALARDFGGIAVDQRGIGLPDKPEDGYDSAPLAGDLVALMEALGHQRFAAVGHDTGYIISYALAADHPHRVDRVALAEIPGPPVAAPSPPLFVPEPINNRLWHLPFNRVDTVPEPRVRGREDSFFGYEFAIQTGNGRELPDDVVHYDVRPLANPDALRGGCGWYRAWDATLARDERRTTRPLTMPVLAIGGAASGGEAVGPVAAHDVQTVVIPGPGPWVAETAAEAMPAALAAFLAPYRDGGCIHRQETTRHGRCSRRGDHGAAGGDHGRVRSGHVDGPSQSRPAVGTGVYGA